MIDEYVGLTRDASTLVERFRRAPTETKADIIVRVLSALVPTPTPVTETAGFLDLGQGVRVPVGERLALFLTKSQGGPDGVAEVRADGLYLDGQKVERSHGSLIQPAMRAVQERKNHRNDKGQIISLNAYRQWHVRRDGKFIPIERLKDPRLARRRSPRLSTEFTAKELGL